MKRSLYDKYKRYVTVILPVIVVVIATILSMTSSFKFFSSAPALLRSFALVITIIVVYKFIFAPFAQAKLNKTWFDSQSSHDNENLQFPSASSASISWIALSMFYANLGLFELVNYASPGQFYLEPFQVNFIMNMIKQYKYTSYASPKNPLTPRALTDTILPSILIVLNQNASSPTSKNITDYTIILDSSDPRWGIKLNDDHTTYSYPKLDSTKFPLDALATVVFDAQFSNPPIPKDMIKQVLRALLTSPTTTPDPDSLPRIAIWPTSANPSENGTNFARSAIGINDARNGYVTELTWKGIFYDWGTEYQGNKDSTNKIVNDTDTWMTSTYNFLFYHWLLQPDSPVIHAWLTNEPYSFSTSAGKAKQTNEMLVSPLNFQTLVRPGIIGSGAGGIYGYVKNLGTCDPGHPTDPQKCRPADDTTPYDMLYSTTMTTSMDRAFARRTGKLKPCPDCNGWGALDYAGSGTVNTVANIGLAGSLGAAAVLGVASLFVPVLAPAAIFCFAASGYVGAAQIVGSVSRAVVYGLPRNVRSIVGSADVSSCQDGDDEKAMRTDCCHGTEEQCTKPGCSFVSASKDPTTCRNHAPTCFTNMSASGLYTCNACDEIFDTKICDDFNQQCTKDNSSPPNCIAKACDQLKVDHCQDFARCTKNTETGACENK
jgi:hypothetical protein